MYEEIPVEIQTNIDGEGSVLIRNLVGEIIEIRGIYRNCSELTTIEITWANGERKTLAENNQDFNYKPRVSIAGKFTDFSIGETQSLERRVNVGNVIIQVTNAGSNGIVSLYFVIRNDIQRPHREEAPLP